MLNGKFYTGLPPKMVERQCATGSNRQESHFFWPDDTGVDSAVETRVKRRNSLQLEAGAERPRLAAVQRLSSVQDEAPTDSVDTRQMFHKEFAKSSIQFYDNLQPSDSNNKSRLPNRTRREVTPKLTDVVRLPPVEAAAEVDPSAARRTQAYSSKIQFYDYVNTNEADATQNNVRRPKMDMNNKRDVELNSKNSPKLQVKHNVRHLSVERDQLTTPSRNVTRKPLNDGHNWGQEQYEPVRRPPGLVPKKILKQQPPWIEDFDESMLDYMDNGVRQLRLRSPAPIKKHVTYSEEADEYAYYDDGLEPAGGRQLRQSPPNMRTGSGQQQHQQQSRAGPYVETSRDTKSLNNHNKSSHNNYNEYNNTKNIINNNNNSGSRSRKILPKLPELTATAPRATRTRGFDDTRTTSANTASTVAAAAAAAAEASLAEQPSPSDPRKHLRSSLCFNGDALVVDVGVAPPSTSAVALARRSSAGQRVSVGLPD